VQSEHGATLRRQFLQKAHQLFGELARHEEFGRIPFIAAGRSPRLRRLGLLDPVANPPMAQPVDGQVGGCFE
jgi:hypothetical protein